MATGRDFQHFGDERDTSAAPSAVTTITSGGSAPTNGVALPIAVRDFDGTSDEQVGLSFWLPPTYLSGGALNFMWLCTGATSGNVVWKTAYVLIHPNSEGSPTDADAASYGTVTSATPLAVPSTAGRIVQTSLDLGVTGAHAGDNLRVLFGRDANAAGDTVSVDVRWTDPWYLSFSVA